MHLPRESLSRRSEEGMAQLASRYLRAVARADKCADGDNSSMCEKPVPWQQIAFPVTLTIGLLVAFTCIGVLIWLHLRRKKREKAEDITDPLEMADYGIDRPGTKKSTSQHSDGSSDVPSRASLQSVNDSVRYPENPFKSPQDPRLGNGRDLTSSHREKP